MKNEYEKLTLAVLKQTASERGIKFSPAIKKADLIALLETTETKAAVDSPAVKKTKTTKKAEVIPQQKSETEKPVKRTTKKSESTEQPSIPEVKAKEQSTVTTVEDKPYKKVKDKREQNVNAVQKVATVESINTENQVKPVEKVMPVVQVKLKKEEKTEAPHEKKVEQKQREKKNNHPTSNHKIEMTAVPVPMAKTVPEYKADIKPEVKSEIRPEKKPISAENFIEESQTTPGTEAPVPESPTQERRQEHTPTDRRQQQRPNRQQELEHLDSGMLKEGILEIMPDGYGFIRCDNYLPGENDVYVAPTQIRRLNLKTGDIVCGNVKVRSQNEKFSALLYVRSINGYSTQEAARRKRFEDLTPIFPNERIHLETPGCGISMRMVDIICPIGKGQRGMIVSQPKAGKTTLLKQIAKAIKKNHPDMHLIILLIDERPEEVTDMKESIEGDNVEVIYSTFDELPENHKRVSEMVIERAKRLVEHQKDVVILLDSITRLARAYNLTVTASGRTLSGGLDPAALHMPKRFFGAARNMREGGSLTILATALVETGSRMDDVVFEEFKGTGNMELVLDRSLSEKRIFPAIDLPKSSTRRDDLLLSQQEMEANFLMRRALNSIRSDDAVERIIGMFSQTKTNVEFIDMVRRTRIV